MGRRWRGLFAGLEDDESPDALAQRAGASGRSALDHAARATAALQVLDRALERILVEDEPALDLAVAHPIARPVVTTSSGVDDAIDELARCAERLADRSDRVDAHDWTRRGVAADGEVEALGVLWDAVDTAVATLKAAEATLQEVRGRLA